MKNDLHNPIPVPWKERLRLARMRVLPAVVFASAVVTVVLLWKDNLGAPTMVGQAEAAVANVSSHKAGVLAGLNVSRFQMVKAGDELGRVMIADPQLLESSLAVIRAEIESLRTGLRPISSQQRNAMDYSRLRLDWMRQRADLATARVNLQLANSELDRTEKLFDARIASQQEMDQATAKHSGLLHQVSELSNLVVECEANFKSLTPGSENDLTNVSEDPVRAEIAVQESRLRLTEEELSPLTLRAPIDGIITAIHHVSGESVTAGQPIVSISATEPSRIVAYLRQPISAEPQPGMKVWVRQRDGRRAVAEAQVEEVGAEMEALPPALQSSSRFAGTELGLPVAISLPPSLTIRPGELVDITASVQ